MIFFNGQSKVTDDLAQQRANDDLRTVVRKDNDRPARIPEYVVTALSPDPLESGGLSHRPKFAVWDQAQLGQAGTSTRQVPTK